ncbi:MAG: recombinase family protein [Taibaiella sp.]|jgi:site-specific DNA recombinase
MINPLKVGIWIRVSTDMQVKDESPEHHELRAKDYINAKGWKLVKTYRLDGVSGKTIMKHPETQRMLRNIKSGQINGLVFSKLVRLARNTKELLEFADIFKSAKANLISISENIDTSTPSGMLFLRSYQRWQNGSGRKSQAGFPPRSRSVQSLANHWEARQHSDIPGLTKNM